MQDYTTRVITSSDETNFLSKSEFFLTQYFFLSLKGLFLVTKAYFVTNFNTKSIIRDEI